MAMGIEKIICKRGIFQQTMFDYQKVSATNTSAVGQGQKLWCQWSLETCVRGLPLCGCLDDLPGRGVASVGGAWQEK